MSPPVQPSLIDICLVLEDETERLDATLSALRRRNRDDALAEFALWQTRSWRGSRDGHCADPERARDLTRWVRDECSLHVEGGRFEHAIALIERYRRQIKVPLKEVA